MMKLRNGNQQTQFPCWLFLVSSGSQMVLGGYSKFTLLEAPVQAVQAYLSATLIVSGGVIPLSALDETKGSNRERSAAEQLLPVTKLIN